MLDPLAAIFPQKSVQSENVAVSLTTFASRLVRQSIYQQNGSWYLLRMQPTGYSSCSTHCYSFQTGPCEMLSPEPSLQGHRSQRSSAVDGPSAYNVQQTTNIS